MHHHGVSIKITRGHKFADLDFINHLKSLTLIKSETTPSKQNINIENNKHQMFQKIIKRNTPDTTFNLKN